MLTRVHTMLMHHLCRRTGCSRSSAWAPTRRRCQRCCARTPSWRSSCSRRTALTGAHTLRAHGTRTTHATSTLLVRDQVVRSLGRDARLPASRALPRAAWRGALQLRGLPGRDAPTRPPGPHHSQASMTFPPNTHRRLRSSLASQVMKSFPGDVSHYPHMFDPKNKGAHKVLQSAIDGMLRNSDRYPPPLPHRPPIPLRSFLSSPIPQPNPNQSSSHWTSTTTSTGSPPPC